MRQRWFGATGQRVPEIVEEGDPIVPLDEALVLEDVSDPGRLHEEHERGTPIVVRAYSVEAVKEALARPEVASVLVPAGRRGPRPPPARRRRPRGQRGQLHRLGVLRLGRRTDGAVLRRAGEHPRLGGDRGCARGDVRWLERPAARRALARLPRGGASSGRRSPRPAVERDPRRREERRLRRPVRRARRPARGRPRAADRGATAAVRPARRNLRQDPAGAVGRRRRDAGGRAARAPGEARLRGRARRRALPLGREREPRGAPRRGRAARSGPPRGATLADVKVVHLSKLEGHPVGKGGLIWKPLRHTLGIEAFGTNAYTAKEARAIAAEVRGLYPDNPGVLYNTACLEALEGEHEAALADLARAVELDGAFAEYAVDDEDFASVRNDPRFLAITGQPEPAGSGT